MAVLYCKPLYNEVCYIVIEVFNKMLAQQFSIETCRFFCPEFVCAEQLYFSLILHQKLVILLWL